MPILPSPRRSVLLPVMFRSAHVTSRIDLTRIRSNVETISALARVPIIAVVKADAYGLGAAQIARAIAERVSGYYVFDLPEAAAYGLAATGRPTIAMQAGRSDAAAFKELNVRPVVWDADRAAELRAARPVLSVDTGQQRFGVPIDDAATVDATLKAGDIDEAFTHATTVVQATALERALRGRVARLHAAGTALLGEPAAALDAVRPGLALYQGALRVSARLVEVRDSRGPAGYTGFQVARHGVILAGYSNGLRLGPCLVNGRRSRILEAGMQSAFVECAAGDRVGDEVVLVGDGLAEQDVAAAWNATPQAVLLKMASMGERRYTGGIP
jgi:alanine racemase